MKKKSKARPRPKAKQKPKAKPPALNDGREGRVMTEAQTLKRRALDAKAASRGMMAEIGKVQTRKAQPHIDKLMKHSKPLGQPSADPNPTLVVENRNINEPSVVNVEPSLVEVHRHRQRSQGQN